VLISKEKPRFDAESAGFDGLSPRYLQHISSHILRYSRFLSCAARCGRIAPMRIARRNKMLYLHKRVPRRYQEVDGREAVWISLATDSEEVAKQKAPLIWQDMIEAWEAKLEGRDADAEGRLAAARNLAKKRGYRFMGPVEVARLPLYDLLQRIESIPIVKGEVDLMEADAALGTAPLPKITVTKALTAYWKLAKGKTLGKSPDQLRRWENPRKKAIANFVEVVGDLPITDITNYDIAEFRDWWVDKLARDGLTPNSANKDITYVASTLREVARANNLELRFQTRGMLLDEGKPTQRPAFSEQWILDKIFAPGALDGLNAEARAILIGMINTGYRPSEASGLKAEHIRLDANIPHILIKPDGRQLKSHNAERIIPLVGVSLEAFRAFPEGFPRYYDNPSLSDTVNKFLRENRLLETPDHSLYGLRHAFEDRMLAAGVDERIRRDLMGHALKRERYGKGATLEHLQAVIKSIAL
jgi:integrase